MTWVLASGVGKADKGYSVPLLVKMPQLCSCWEIASTFMLCRCSVQRVAKRAGVLLPSREALLDDIGFDWTCADALS